MGITFTAIAAKVSNALLLNYIQPEIWKILWKNQNGFRRNRSTTSFILTIPWIIKGVQTKNLKTTLEFVYFSKTFDSIYRGKMEQILFTYGLPPKKNKTNCYHDNDTWWKVRKQWFAHLIEKLHQHYRWSLTRNYISTIFDYTLSSLRT